MWRIREKIRAQALFLNSSKDGVGQGKIYVVLRDGRLLRKHLLYRVGLGH